MTVQAAGLYDNPYFHDNVYGHAVALLKRRSPTVSSGCVHLDIGCGFGRIAEPLTEMGLTYVGADGDPVGLEALRARGFEAHHLWLSEEDKTFAALDTILDGRQLSSISMLDTLEHLADGAATLRAISRLAQRNAALVVISVPNVTHVDIGLRLAFGRWDYTEKGLLDHTHTRLFGLDVLERVLRHAGLYPVDANDVLTTRSDQHFPTDHPALARGTLLNAMLMGLRKQASDTATVNQFVRLCAPGRPAQDHPFPQPDDLDPARPFLSVVIRTQGKRLHTFAEALTALAGQSDKDFEVVVVGHRLTIPQQKAVERAIEDSPDWLRGRCRLIRVDDGNRTRPLNVGFAAAEGRYIAILDDDDMPFGHWIETFRGLHDKHEGRLLRAATVRQDVGTIEVQGLPGLRATGPLERIYAQDFDLMQHLHGNQTPPVSLAFPRGAFHDLGIRFDESLTTTEDWDYLLRVASVVGVASTPEITSIYRWWPSDESSRTLHPQEEWACNYGTILGKIDATPLLCPPGTARRMHRLFGDVERETHRADAAQGEAERSRRFSEAMQAEAERARHGEAEAAAERDRHRSERDRHRSERDATLDRLTHLRAVLDILGSTSWRLSAPIRLLGRILGKPSADREAVWQMDGPHLVALAAAMRRSTSWRLTAPIRLLRGG